MNNRPQPDARNATCLPFAITVWVHRNWKQNWRHFFPTFPLGEWIAM
jgi:hypothetical protein